MLVDVQGHWDEKYAPVIEAFIQNIESGKDLGASFCVTQDGETVVDIWGGWLDPEKSKPWQEDTIVNVFSTTKTMAALSCLLLADRGDLDLYEPVVNFWPEFGQNGKEEIATRHVLSHTAGLPGLDVMVGEAMLYDHDKICELLAAQKPWWEPGTKSGYHAFTQGYLLGEVVRRKTGRSLGKFFHEEIAAPLGVDFYIGTPPEQDHKVAPLWPPEDPAHHMLMGEAPYTSMPGRVGRSPAIDSNWARTVPWRRAEIPAGGGHGNARAVAEIHAILANKGMAKGQRFMSEEGPMRIFDVQYEGDDLVFMKPAKFGMGFGLNGEKTPVGLNPHICYWGGWGGSLARIDLDEQTTVSYVMNQMRHRGLEAVDPRVSALMGGVLAAG